MLGVGWGRSSRWKWEGQVCELAAVSFQESWRRLQRKERMCWNKWKQVFDVAGVWS